MAGDGTVRRCHFVSEPIRNLYDGSWRDALRPRPCPNRICDCHIGYAHLTTLPASVAFMAIAAILSALRGRRRGPVAAATTPPP